MDRWFEHRFSLLNNRLVHSVPVGMTPATSVLDPVLPGQFGHQVVDFRLLLFLAQDFRQFVQQQPVNF